MADQVKRLQQLNPGIPLYHISEPEFRPYGKVIRDYDVAEIMDAALKIEMPESGSLYELSLSQFESCKLAEKLQNECFGEMEIQVGYCWGYNDRMNALEYHKSSEINIAVTPMVLLLGLVTDIVNNEYSSERVKAFFVDAGEMVEIYGTTLHFCPCQVSREGFRSIVVLPKGTNAPLSGEVKGSLLYRKNKWLICHDENKTLIERGVYPGIHGENIRIIGE